MNTTPHWHVVYTKPNCERKTVQQLTQRGFEAYFPHRSFLQKEIAGKALLPSFVFVYCETPDLQQIKRLNGVVSLLYWHDQPAQVTKEEITTLKYVLNNFTSIDVVKTGLHSAASTAEPSDDTLVFPLPSLGYSLQARLQKEKAPVAETYLVNGAARNAGYRMRSGNRFAYLLRQIPTFFFH